MANDGARITVPLVDDRSINLNGRGAIRSREGAFTGIGRSVRGKEALERARTPDAEVVLVDIRMPGMDASAPASGERSGYRKTPDPRDTRSSGSSPRLYSTMRRTASITLLASLLLLGGCGPSLRSMSKVPQEAQRTVAFWSNAQANGGPAPFQYAIVEGFGSPESAGYLCRLVTPDQDSVLKVMWEPNAPARYPGMRKAGSQQGRAAQKFACAAGVDHVMMTDVSTEYETALLQPAEQYSLFGKLVLGKVDKPAVFGPVPRKVIFRLRYIDGHTGKVLWKMKKTAYPQYGGYERVAKSIGRKFHRRFPFRKTL